jgi:hypothetical protein
LARSLRLQQLFCLFAHAIVLFEELFLVAVAGLAQCFGFGLVHELQQFEQALRMLGRGFVFGPQHGRREHLLGLAVEIGSVVLEFGEILLDFG